MMRVKFRKFGSCTATGSFAPGDVARVSDALARHLVKDARVAEYADAPPHPAPPAAPVRVLSRREARRMERRQ